MANIQKIKRPIEDFTSEIAGELASVPKDIGKSILQEIGLGGLVGSSEKKVDGKLEGSIDLRKKIDSTEKKLASTEVSMEAKMRQMRFVNESESKELARTKQTMQQQVEALLRELRAEAAKIQAQTADLTGEARNLSVSSTPNNLGQYHVNFFEYVISSLKDIRRKVNESRMWLNLWTRKKQQRGYWQQFKKKGGMEWAMNEERALATSNG